MKSVRRGMFPRKKGEPFVGNIITSLAHVDKSFH
jgi:hypothetical protein